MRDDILEGMFTDPEKEPDFEVGQTVRVISRIDVNMPADLDYWLDTKCEVLRIIPRGLFSREWSYELRHPNEKICEFKLEELDLRYRRQKANTHQERLVTKQERLKNANEFIAVIASCGRQFFEHKGFVSTLELSATGRVFFIDQYTRKRIYTHRKYVRWDGFTNGGTMKSLVESMRNYITQGTQMRAAYFQPKMDNGFENPWGYGEDILKVRDAAVRLGLAKEAE